MKSQVFTLLAIIALVAAQETTPVTKVVNMLKDLRAKNVADGEHEAKVMNKFACWCKDASARKAQDIHNAEDELRTLGQEILKLKGKVETLGAEIDELAQELAENSDKQETATNLRQKRNAEFMAMQSETKEELGALQGAIKILFAGTGNSLLQADSAARAMSAVQSALDKMPSDSPLNLDHVSFLSEFVKNGADGKYAPQSATIQGILTDMYTTFAANLEDGTMTEAKQNRLYEEEADVDEQAYNKADAIKSKKEKAKADAESLLADTTETYDQTMAQMKENIAFFDVAKKKCEDKYAESVARVKARTAEKAGIDKALELLTSDAARDLFAKSIKPGVEAGASFLQIESNEDAQAAPMKAYKMLKAQATKTKSLRLAMLAVRVHSAKAGHFDTVIKSIDGMVDTLNSEAASDLNKRDDCKASYQQIARDSSDQRWKIKNNEAEINKLEKEIERREEEKAETQQQLKEAQQYRTELTAQRKQDHADWQSATKDDNAAIALLNKAKSSFTKYYKDHGIKMGPIQGLRLNQEPEFEVSKDQAPDATLSSNDNSKGQAKGIISLMDYIIEDLEDEVTNGAKAERNDQADYEEELATGLELEEELKSKIVSLNGIIKNRLKTDKAAEEKDLKNNNGQLAKTLKYQSDIKTDCDWIIENFDGRAEARAQEMDGLASAKDALSGAALLQVKAPAATKSVGKHFLGMH